MNLARLCRGHRARIRGLWFFLVMRRFALLPTGKVRCFAHASDKYAGKRASVMRVQWYLCHWIIVVSLCKKKKKKKKQKKKKKKMKKKKKKKKKKNLIL
jgi:hypothetical protein